jgi:hypothetical protein
MDVALCYVLTVGGNCGFAWSTSGTSEEDGVDSGAFL